MAAPKLDPQEIQRARDALAKYGSQKKAARALGMARSTFQKRLEQRPKNTPQPAAAQAQAAKKGRTLSEFRAEHDKDFIVPKKIKAALEVLGSGWEYEATFARLAGVGLADLGRYRDQFSDYVVLIGRDTRRAWAGTKSIAEQMRAMVR